MTSYSWWVLIPFVAISAWIMLGHRRRVQRWRERQSGPSGGINPPAASPTADSDAVAETRARWMKPLAPDHLPAAADTNPEPTERSDAPRPRAVAELLGLIEAEVRRLWPTLPEPSPEQIETGGAFGTQSMAFAQWLTFVFVPNARLRVEQNALPSTSSVAAMAVREFSGDSNTDDLVALLSEFDEAVERSARDG